MKRMERKLLVRLRLHKLVASISVICLPYIFNLFCLTLVRDRSSLCTVGLDYLLGAYVATISDIVLSIGYVIHSLLLHHTRQGKPGRPFKNIVNYVGHPLLVPANKFLLNLMHLGNFFSTTTIKVMTGFVKRLLSLLEGFN